MARNEVLERLDAAGSDRGPIEYELVHVDLLRAAAELIRAGGWSEIHEAPRDKTMLFGMHDHGRWMKLYVEKSVAVDLGCTHYLPEPEPPAREVPNERG